MKPVRVWIGLVLVTLGVFGILDATDLVDAGTTISRWWPVAIIGLGVVAMLAQRRLSVGTIVITAFGFVLLADRQQWTDGSIVGPTVLVLVGIAVLASLPRRRMADHRRQWQPLAVFGSTSAKDHSEHLTHADVSAIFGGATLDLRDAHIDQEASVDAFALFGGIQVLVPKGWRIELSGLPIMGGYEDKTDTNGSVPPEAPTLAVNATTIFGGVEVAHQPHRR